MTEERRQAPVGPDRRAATVAWALVLVPVVGTFLLPREPARIHLWLLALAPVIVRARSRGPGGAAEAAALILLLLGAVEGAAVLAGLDAPSPEVLASMIAALVLFGGAVAWLAGALGDDRDRAERLAFTDPLTGLPNRRHAQLHLDRAFGAAERGRPLAAVLFDIDRFKDYNDSHGHAAGDRVLRDLAGILRGSTRRMNLSARYGGEEFLSILSECDIEGAVAFAQRVRAALREADVVGGPPTLSAGVAIYAAGMDLPDELVAAADEALYRAKREGRDRISIFDPIHG